MTAVDQFVATSIEHIKRQFSEGDSHGQYADNRAIKRERLRQWAAMTDEEKREAERRYFVETWPLLRNTAR